MNSVDDAPKATPLLGMTLSPSGEHTLVSFGDEAAPVVATVPTDQLESLAALALQMAEHARAAQDRGWQAKAFDIAHATANLMADGFVLLAFELPNGGRLAFRAPPLKAVEIGAHFAAAAGASVSLKGDPMGTPRQTH